MKHPPIERTHLLQQLDVAPRIVLLCAPSGFGKSVLLRQFHERHPNTTLITVQPGDTLDTIFRQVPDGSVRLLIDDAWLLPAAQIEALVNDPHRTVTLAVRHNRYARVQLLETRGQLLLLDASDLTFTPAETAALCQRPHDVYTHTLGWPLLTAHTDRPLFDATTYFQDLLGDLPPGVLAQLLSFEVPDVWDAYLHNLVGRHDGSFETVMNTGVAVIPQGDELVVHPALWEHLLTQLPSRPRRHSLQDAAQALRTYVAQWSPQESVTAVEAFFARHTGELTDSTESLEAKVALLNDVGLQQMSATLRDRYAECLLELGRTDDARAALIYQRERGQPSTRTYASLAFLASFRNDFTDFEAQLAPMKACAMTEADWSLAWNLESLYRIRIGRYDEGIQAADRMYRHAIASGSVELHIQALRRLSYAHQLKGDITVGLHWAYQAIRLLDGRPELKEFSSLAAKTFHFIGDMLKDAGRHDEALKFILDAVALLAVRGREGDRQQVAVEATIAYLYTTRGLIYLELGQVEEAADAFQRSTDEFERADNRAGLPMSVTYLAAALYRLGRTERLEYCATYLRRLAATARPAPHEHDEQRAYQPLVEALYARSQGDVMLAIESLRAIRLDGVKTYDSVLLAQLYLLRFLLEQDQLQAGDVQQFIDVLDHRGSPSDETAVMYVQAFPEVFEACRQSGVQAARWQRILAAASQRKEVQSTHVVRVWTLGDAALEVNGQRVALRNTYPVLALSFLLEQEYPVSAERMGEALWSGNRNAARNATSAVSMLRCALREMDQELERLLVSPQAGGSGYALVRSNRWQVCSDVEVYLSEAFTPMHGNREELWSLLEQVRPFLPRVLDSRFVQDMNETINRRAKAVATHLADSHALAGDMPGSVRALLLYLRLDLDYQLIDRLVGALNDLQGNVVYPELVRFAVDAHADDVRWNDLLLDAEHLSQAPSLRQRVPA